MPGFIISNIDFENCIDQIDSNNEFKSVRNKFVVDDYCIYRATLDKFVDDKLFVDDKDLFVITEGIFLNKKQLMVKYNSDWNTTVKRMIGESENAYFDIFRGVFSGAHYNKSLKKWMFYTSTTGEKPLFYYEKNGKFVVASDLNWIACILKNQGMSYEVDNDAIYDMLTYGFMASNRTYIGDVKKLEYGEYLVWQNGKFEKSRYYDLNYLSKDCNGQNDVSDEEIIEKLDILFTEAVNLEYEKDREYGYKSFACLSGGLDSRMAAWIANESGYDNCVNLTFGRSGYLDEIIAKKVAKQLGNDLIIKSLDDGLFIKDYQPIIAMNSGLTLYSGISLLYYAIKDIDFSKYGILHTGDVGDAVIGVFDGHSEYPHTPGAYSVRLSDKVKDVYDNRGIEKFKMATRGYNGVIGSQMMSNHYADSVTPFLYRDFIDYCIGSIPHDKRKDHYIYKKWILAKHPEAAKIPVERYHGGLLTEGKLKQNLRKAKKMGILACCDWALWKLKLKKSLNKKLEKNDMNPFDYWYESNASIKNTINDCYCEKIEKLCKRGVLNPDIKADFDYLFANGSVVEKTQCITALCAVEMLFV